MLAIDSDIDNKLDNISIIKNIFMSLLVLIIFSGVGGLVLSTNDDNANSIVLFISLFAASMVMAKSYYKYIPVNRVTLTMSIISVLSGVAVQMFPFGAAGSHLLAPYLAYGNFGKILFIVLLCFVIPVIEEIYFRGLLFPTISCKIGPVYAGIITVALFSFLHFMSLANLLLLVIIGAVNTWLVHKSNSIVTGILSHISYNITWFVIALVDRG